MVKAWSDNDPITQLVDGDLQTVYARSGAYRREFVFNTSENIIALPWQMLKKAV